MVPNGWSLERFDSVAELIHGFQFREHHFSDSGVPVIKIGNISNLNGINIEQCSFIPEAMATEFTKYIVNAGDVLMALTGGTLGKTCRVQDDIVHCLQNYRVGNFKPKAGLLDKGFLYYFLTSSTVQKRIENIVNEAAQPNVGKADFEKINVLTPPLNEQKKIAKILSTWDKAISTTEQLLANSQQQKKALMQQLLTGKKRLLDNNEVRFVGEWKYVALGCVFEKISNGVTYDAKSLSGLPVTRIETISTGKIDFKKVGWAPDSENTKRFKLEIGDILYSHINSLEHIGRVAYFNDNRSLYHGMNLLLLRTKKQNNSLFLYHLLNSQVGKKYAKLYAKSAVNQASISTADIKAFKVYIPESEEQQKIATVLSTADQEITTLQQKLAALKLEKKALMQQLLTGKRRVKVEEAA